MSYESSAVLQLSAKMVILGEICYMQAGHTVNKSVELAVSSSSVYEFSL